MARRYRGLQASPLPIERLFPEEQAGARTNFWVLEGAGPDVHQIEAGLLHVSTHALWYVESELPVSLEDITRAAKLFDEETYPFVITHFGHGKVPSGKVTVLIARLSDVGGYFTSIDQLPAVIDHDSNERAIIYINASVPVGSPGFMGTLAHELQHFVHSWVDPDEETWINEGLSEFASSAAGYPTIPGSIYLQMPETSVVHWPMEIQDSGPSYAGALLFLHYLASRTGGLESMSRLIAEPADGVQGIQAYLRQASPGLEFRDVLGDWMVANYLGAFEGPYGYPGRPGFLQIDRQVSGPGTLQSSVPQFGAWYVHFPPGSVFDVHFQGAAATPLLPEPPPSGPSCWWGNRGDGLDATLTRALDLAAVESATLSFWQWYQMEPGYDYGYVAISTDGGGTWVPQAGRHTSHDDSNQRALGPGYTGSSGGWAQEQIDLSAYAGQKVLLRFEQLTDESISGDGWCIDDISVPEIGLEDDAESDGAWEQDGFMRLPAGGVVQEFVLRLIRGEGRTATVERIVLSAGNQASFTVGSGAVLLVTAMAPKTRQPATFTLVSSAPALSQVSTGGR